MSVQRSSLVVGVEDEQLVSVMRQLAAIFRYDASRLDQLDEIVDASALRRAASELERVVGLYEVQGGSM